MKILIFVAILIFASVPAPVNAQSNDCTEKKLRDLGVTIINCDGQEVSRPCTASVPITGQQSAGPTSVYMIGDSITQGSLAELATAFNDIGVTNQTIDGVSSRRLSEGGTNLDGLSVLIDSPEAYTDVDSVVIALGTNNGVSTSNISRAIEAIKLVNPDAAIYWVNLGVANQYRNSPLDVTGWNTTIQTNSSLGYKVINWNSVVTDNPTYIDQNPSTGLGVHPVGEGKRFFAKTVTDAISGTSSGSCSVGLSGSENQERVFNFFVSNGFTPEQAAGIVGNMIHESGVEPKKYQGYYGGQLFSSAEVASGSVPARGDGWGIVQWTPSSKIIGTSFNAGTPYEEIDTLEFQVEFLLGQLNGEGLGGSISSERAAGNILRSATTVEDAAIYFACHYERFRNSSTFSGGSRICTLSNPEYAKRIASSIDVLTRFGS